MPAAFTRPRIALSPRFASAARAVRAFGDSAARFRVAAYAALVLGVGGWLCLHRTGEGLLAFDEAYFAVTTEHMLRTGDYVVPTIGEPHGGAANRPHLNATPLYNWLCCLTADAIGDGPLRYRLWSGLFGVGCGLAVFLLGTLLFGPEVGLLAGLLVVTNREFLSDYGARQGTMNTGVAFFVTLAVLLYARASRSQRPGLWWALVGVSVAGAVLMKPPVLGGFFFCGIVAHHLLSRGDLPGLDRLRGPVLAAAVAVLLALPWYAAVYLRVGPEALEQLLIFNSVRRAASAAAYSRAQVPEPWWLYLKVLWDSSLGFKLAGPAAAYAAWAVVRGRHTWGLVLALAAGFTAALTVAAEKHPWYLIPAYPFVALLVAGFLLAGLSDAGRWPWRWPRRVAAVAGIIAAAYSVRQDYRLMTFLIRYVPLPAYAPLLVHKASEPDLAAGTARLVLYRFPTPDQRLDIKLGFGPTERLYLVYWLPHAVLARTEGELDGLIADGVPTAVFLPPQLPARLVPGPGLSRRPDARLDVVSGLYLYPVLAFNGAESGMRLRESLAGQLVPSKP